MSTPPPPSFPGYRPADGATAHTGPTAAAGTSGFPAPTGLPTVVTEPGGPGRRRGRGVWWGVGGALVASAVWAVTVLTVPSLVHRDTVTPAAPQTAGYRLVDDLCGTARLTSFGQLYPSPSGTPYHYTTRTRALDDMYCSQYRKKVGSDSAYYSIYLQVQLHKVTDPRPEFEAQRDGLDQRRYQITPVPGLGDEAYLGYLDDPGAGDKTWHYLTHVLYVRQGGMTCYTSWSGSYQEGKGAAPDREQVRLALMSDTRELLRALGGTV